jgi:hypothetical protein
LIVSTTYVRLSKVQASNLVGSWRKDLLVIFDTCTKPDYYRDVHKVLASPMNSIVRYDYERRLWTVGAAGVADNLTADKTPVRALLMYGQLKSYKQDDTDPEYMLTWENGIFIPTRAAKVVNVSYDPHANNERENIYIHLRLKHFIDPKNPEIELLIGALEARRELPFGRANGHKWISECPEGIDADRLFDGSDDKWPLVIDAFASNPSQFSGDVFWRITGMRAATKIRSKSELIIKSRDTNTFGSQDQWNADYSLNDTNRYFAEIRNYIPVADDRELPPNAVVSAKEDTSNLLILPETKVSLRRNATEHLKFGVQPIDFIEKEDAKLIIETEIDGHGGEYPPGSVVELTVRIAKTRLRLFSAMIFAFVATIGTVAGAGFMRQNIFIGLVIMIVSVTFGYFSAWLYTNRLKIVR